MDLIESGNSKSQVNRHPWEIARFKVISTLINKHLGRKVHDKLLVFDVGCGDTFFSETLLVYYPDFEIAAIDIAFTDALKAEYREKFRTSGSNIRLFNTIDEAAAYYKRAVSLVLLLDVIEHIEDDRGFLSKLTSSDVIDSTTTLILTVPAFQSLFSSHDKFLQHYRRYSLPVFSGLLSASKLKIIRKGYFFTFLLVVRIMQVMLEKVKKPGSAEGVGNWNGGALATKLTAFILQTDFVINRLFNKVHIHLPGLSLYTICKKSV